MTVWKNDYHAIFINFFSKKLYDNFIVFIVKKMLVKQFLSTQEATTKIRYHQTLVTQIGTIATLRPDFRAFKS